MGEGWACEDAWSFTWYTLTTIGLGDKTMDLTHPFFAMAILVLLLLLGTAAAQALMHGMQRAASVIERAMAGESMSGKNGLDEVLDRLAQNNKSRELRSRRTCAEGNDDDCEEVVADECQSLLRPMRSEMVAFGD